MANYADVVGRVVGSQADREKFLNAMFQKNEDWIGRGVDGCVSCDNHTDTSDFDGLCKWSAFDCLVDNAQSMKSKPELWDNSVKTHNIYTLDEYARTCNVDVEIWCKGIDNDFVQNILVKGGEMIVKQFDSNTLYLCTFDTQEKANAYLGRDWTAKEIEQGFVELDEVYGCFVI